MPNLSSHFDLFLNPSRIQIRTQFLWVPVYYRYWAHVLLFSPFSLSLSSSASLLLSLALSHYRARTLLPSSPRAPYSLSSLLSTKPPHRSSLLHLPTVLTLPTNTDRESASSRFACVAAALAGSSCTKKRCHPLLLQTAPSPAPKRRQPLLPQAAPIWWLCRWVWQWVWWRFFMGLMVKSWWICRCFVGLMLKSWGFADRR
jgi:hypothetical protein